MTSPTKSNQFEFVGLVAGTKFWSLRLDFVAKMVSSHDTTSPCDLLQGLVAGTSPIVCADLKTLKTQNVSYSQTCIKGSPLGNGLSEHLIQADCLIQVVKNTGQNTVKMPFYITVNDVVYSLCMNITLHLF